MLLKALLNPLDFGKAAVQNKCETKRLKTARLCVKVHGCVWGNNKGSKNIGLKAVSPRYHIGIISLPR